MVGVILAGLSHAAEEMNEQLSRHWEFDRSQLRYQLEKRSRLSESAHKSRLEEFPNDIHALVLETDKTPTDLVLRRTRALLNQILQMANAPDLSQLDSELTELESRLQHDDTEEGFFEACLLRREIAMQNPLLDFDELLFTGYAAKEWIIQGANVANYSVRAPGAGLYTVSGFKSGTATVKDVLENAVVQPGPYNTYNGKTLSNKNPEWEGDALFHCPALSYDGTEVIFSWAPDIQGDKYGDRAPNMQFVLFKMNLDGSGLTQLTEHPWSNAYHPCWLPNGRIVFISERLDRQERCGGNRLGGNLFSMKADGSDLFPLSWHETNELYPSVDNSGMIVYTRWDYVDRKFSTGQHLWTCYPDGRDPRAPHGNYGRPGDPDCEVAIRAIPGTQGLYSAIETGHHSCYFGNLVIIDTRKNENVEQPMHHFWPGTKDHGDKGFNRGATSPDVKVELDRFYLEPWPLSKEFHIVTLIGKVLLVDRFRNEILLYDAGSLLGERIPARFPQPVKARPKPTSIPVQTYQGERRKDSPKATISVQNVYEADFEWPEGTKITQLRVVQIIPKAWSLRSGHNDAMIGYSDGGIPRLALGVVPVEEDGSAYFEAPIECEIYFQALNEKGMAVQTMRSGTYVHPGEHLSCLGCHEDRWSATPVAGTPKALTREPSKLEPEPEGSCPLSYARLVRIPVFEKKCAPCHQDSGKGISFGYWKDMTCPEYKEAHGLPKAKGISPQYTPGDIERFVRWHFASASNGACEWTKANGIGWGNPFKVGSEFAYEEEEWRTKPGTFGALASKLTKHLTPDHHNVQLTDEEFRRVVVWMDLNALNLSTHDPDDEVKARQKAGEVVWPYIDVDPSNPTHVQLDGDGSYAKPSQRSRQFSVPSGAASLKVSWSDGRVVVQNAVSGPMTVTIYSPMGRTGEILQTESLETGCTLIPIRPPAGGVYMISVEQEERRGTTRAVIINR